MPPTPTADPSSWPRQGISAAAGYNVGGWAKAAPEPEPDVPPDYYWASRPAVPDDRT